MTGTGNSSKGKPGTGSTALRAYKRLWAYTKRYLWMFLLGVAGVSVDASMQAAFIKFMEPLIDRVFVGKDSEYGLWLAGIIFLVAIARMVGNFVGVYGMEWVGRKVVADLRQELFNQYVSLPASYYDRNSSGQLSNPVRDRCIPGYHAGDHAAHGYADRESDAVTGHADAGADDWPAGDRDQSPLPENQPPDPGFHGECVARD